MQHRAFFSFHYPQDISRVKQILSIPNITASSAAGFTDGALWIKAKKNKKKGNSIIKRMIDEALKQTTVTVICLGHDTVARKYIGYEIDQSIARDNAILVLRINHLKDHDGKVSTAGDIPEKIISKGYEIHDYTDNLSLMKWLDEAVNAAGKSAFG